MKITILTLFPEMFPDPFDHSIIKRAREKKLIDIELINIRNFSTDKHKTVDDRPYGGGRGMILKVDVLNQALLPATSYQLPATSKRRIILLDPQGKVFNQRIAKRLSGFDHLILICGHYEGVDERVKNLIDEEISIGDYILTGGEIPAMVLTDAVARLIPKVLEKEEAVEFESFTSSLLEYPQYTRPPIYRRWKVPKILLSGDHAKIEKWRKEQALKRTKKRRPDLALTQKG